MSILTRNDVVAIKVMDIQDAYTPTKGDVRSAIETIERAVALLERWQELCGDATTAGYEITDKTTSFLKEYEGDAREQGPRRKR